MIYRYRFITYMYNGARYEVTVDSFNREIAESRRNQDIVNGHKVTEIEEVAE